MESISTPVFIAGAGPAGASAALKLNSLGIPCTIIDKATFPRDKICGDALSGKVMLNLSRIHPHLIEHFYNSAWKEGSWGIKFIAPNGRSIAIPFLNKEEGGSGIAPGFVVKRLDFDNFLAEQLREAPLVKFMESCTMELAVRENGGFAIRCNNGMKFHTPMLMDAMGAHSSFARNFAGLTKREAHYAGALRAYYKGVTGFNEGSFIELHFLSQSLPGYFWMFSLPNGEANIGIGMRSDMIRKKKVNLNKLLDEIVLNHPDVKDRFKNATLLGPVKGFGLPLGSKPRPISGDHFVLLGDAGHLVDPLTGEGIGNGMYSGVFAAELLEKCIAQNDYSAKFLKDYDRRVERVIGKEMKLSYRLQQLMNNPRLINFLANFIANNKHITQLISRMYTDFELRKKLVQPRFWLRLLLLKKL